MGFLRRTPKVTAVMAPGRKGRPVEPVGEASYQPALEQLAGGRKNDSARVPVVAALVPEPNNKHDKNAVQVQVQGELVAYLSRGDAAEYQPVLARLFKDKKVVTCNAEIRGGQRKTRNQPQHHFGIFLDLCEPGELG